MTRKKKAQTSFKERRNRASPLARLLPDLARKAYRSRGFIHDEIIRHWPDIIGADLARQSQPIRLHFQRGKRTDARLDLRVTPAFAPIVHHQMPVILARLNTYFGYAAVSDIKLLQGTVQEERKRAVPIEAEPDQNAINASTKLANPIKDDKLRLLLQQWGAHILASKNRQ